MSALDIERVRRALPGRRIDYYDSVDSTMTAAAGLPIGAAVVAEQQSAGQGRLGRSWYSEPESGLYCTMVIAPSPVLTLALGLAARGAILESTGLCCDIRWPNDLMLGEKKVAGILVQVVEGSALAGIGINVNHRQFPPELEGEATSLWQAWLALRGAGCQPAADCQSASRPVLPAPEGGLATRRRLTTCPTEGGRGQSMEGPSFSREDLLIALLRSAGEFASMARESVLRLFTEASSYVKGRRVTVDQSGGQIRGVTAGLDESGFLRLRTDDGADTLILAGGVRAAGS